MSDTQERNTSGRRKRKAKNKKVKNSIVLILFRIVLVICLILIFAVSGAVIGAVFGIIQGAPELSMISVKPDVYTSILYDAKGQEVDRLHGGENREYVTIDKIPKNMQNAIVAIEDERFYSHNGVDIRGMFRAAYSTLMGKGVQGASTITQQLIKNNVSKISKNNLESKIREQYLAVKYEKSLKESLGSKTAAKKYILELYLNTIGLHHGYSGVQAASLGYFGKDTSELDLAESAVIAAITNNPSYYTPRVKPENNRKRVILILNKMLELGMITKTEHDDALAEDVYAKVSATGQIIQKEGTVHSYFVDSVFDSVSKDLQAKYSISATQANNMLYNGGLQIYMTLDTSMQKIMDTAFLDDALFSAKDFRVDIRYVATAENATTKKQHNFDFQEMVKSKADADDFVVAKRAEITAQLEPGESIIAEKIEPISQPQAAMVIMDYYTGEVKALTGGRGPKMVDRSLNRATDSPRQPGSVFKVLASFAPGIDLKVLTPATVIDDVPYTKGDYSPKNWYKNPSYRGLSTIRDGVRDSMNIVAVKAMDKVGVSRCFDYLKNFGFTTLVDREEINGKIFSDINEATALGGLTYGVTQIDVTGAFGAIANGGNYNKPILYTKVLNHDGQPLLENVPAPRQVLKKTTAFMLTDMMKDVVNAGTGGSAKFKNSKMNIAGKTGTTTDSRDLTFVGYTPYYVAGIWMGYDRHDKKVTGMTSTNHHTLLWSHIMEQVHQGLENKEFVRPEGITTAYICQESGKIAVAGLCDADPRGNRARTEFFETGTQPTTSCDVHVKVTYDTSTGMVANEFCPKDVVKTRVGIARPTPYKGSEVIGDAQYEIPYGVLHGEICTVHTEYGATGTATANPTDENGNPLMSEPEAETGGNTSHTAAPADGQTHATQAPQAPVVPEWYRNVLPDITAMPVPAPTTAVEQVPTAAPVEAPVVKEPIMPETTQRTDAVFDEPVSVDGFQSPQ